MDGSNNKVSDFECRASRRISRTASVRTTGDAHDADAGDALLDRNLENDISNNAYDDYNLALAAVVSDGFRPSPPGDSASTFSVAANTHPLDSYMSRPSLSSTASETFADSETLSGSSGLAPNSPSSNLSSFVPSTSGTSCTSSLPHSRDLDPQTQPDSALPSSAPQGRSVQDRPTSIAKPPGGYIFPSTVGGASRASRMSGRNSDAASVASSSMPQIQADEPYQGPSGPSFPYQLYPQNVRMARTASTSTAAPSVAPEPDAAYTGPRGPTFPYSMYPQTGMPVLNTVPVVGIAGIPVGFSGMPDNYQRRIGPDGEDVADMIGPDGHTEQLPPYSKYPEDTYARKMAATASASQPDPLADTQMTSASSIPPGTAAQPNTVPIEPIEIPQTDEEAALEPLLSSRESMPAPPVPAHPHTLLGAIQPVPGAGGLGLAARNPEYDGTEDLESPHSRHSLRSFNSEGSSRELNAAAYSEKGRRRPKNALKRIGGRRLLDVVPCWAICLLIAILIVLAVILGAVLGSFLAKHKKGATRRPVGDTYPTAVTVTVDATPIPTPSGLPNLPLGTFSLQLQRESAPAACFNDSKQASAWSCSIPFMQEMSITIDVSAPATSGAQYTVDITCNESTTVSNNVFWYGEQPPTFGGPMPLQLVSDTAEPNRGPAWFKMVPYNKTVILQESLLTPTATATSVNRRDIHQTLQTTALHDASSPFAKKQTLVALEGDKPWICTWPDTVLEVFIYPNQNASAPTQFFTAWPTPTTSSTPTPPPNTAAHGTPYTATTSTPPTTSTSAPTPFPTFMGFPPPMPLPYPRVVKVEERRMADSPQATCVQYEMKAGASGIVAVPNMDAYGNQIQIVISEIESGPALKRTVHSLEVDTSSLSQCGCIWMMT